MIRTLTPSEIQPVIRIANYHAVLPGQVWPNRRLPDLQLILILQGEFEYLEENSTPLHLTPGAVLLIEPSIWHTFRHLAESGAGFISGMHFEFTPVGTWAAGDYRLALTPERVTQVTDGVYLHERFRRLAQVYNSYHPYRTLQMRTVATEIMLILAAHWRQPLASELSPRMLAMIQFIRENLQVPLTRQDLAKAFRVSPEHVNWLFRKELGMTPSAVINRERVMLAYRLIHEKGRSVKEAAYEVGYTDPFYFSRVFKTVFGIPPSQIA